MLQVGDGALQLQLQELVLCCGERKKHNPCMAYCSFGSISRRGNTFTGDGLGEKNAGIAWFESIFQGRFGDTLGETSHGCENKLHAVKF